MDAPTAAAVAADGYWVDVGSFITAVLYACWHRHKTRSTKAIISKATATDFVNGLGLFPLFLLIVGPFRSGILEAVLASNKLILAVAGVMAIFAILED